MLTIVLVSLLGIASVHGDISLTGYKYKVPQTSYGVPAFQTVNGKVITEHDTSNSAGSFGSNGQGSDSVGYQSIGNSGYGSSSGSEYSAGNGYSGIGGGYSTANSYSGNGHHSVSNGAGHSTYTHSVSPVISYQASGSSSQSGYQSYNQYQSSSQYNGNSVQVPQYIQSTQPAQVFKHFYVHSAPEEPVVRAQQQVVLPPPQKHYKVIFIKAPSDTAASAPIVPIQPQSEEKTVVYVLLKKPEISSQVIAPKFEVKPPTKPEVYFIKYNNNQGSQAVIDNIVNDYNKNHQSVSFVGSDAGNSGASNGYTSSGSSVVSGLQGSSSAAVSSAHDGENYGYSDANNAYESGSSHGVALADSGSASGDYSSSNTIVNNQGIPHETYGPPHFKSS